MSLSYVMWWFFNSELLKIVSLMIYILYIMYIFTYMFLYIFLTVNKMSL